MKAILIICTLFIGSSLLTLNETPNTGENFDIEGVWELQNHFLYDDDMRVETIENENGYRQVKMFSNGRVMWTRYDPSDSNEWFGYGTYEIKDGMLHEQIEFASGPMMKIVDTTQVFKFQLVMGDDSYQQIELDKDGNRSMAENYIRVK